MSNRDDPFDLQRFVIAQDSVYEDVCAELGSGEKQSHWMWFIFPQVRGLGRSMAAQKYSISSLEEARAYMEHPLLGGRLHQCTELVLAIGEKSAAEIFGHPDDLKFRSSMTLFARAAEDNAVFRKALRTYFNGQEDQLTLSRL